MIHRPVFSALFSVSFADPGQNPGTQLVKEHSPYREILIPHFYGNFFYAWPPTHTHIYIHTHGATEGKKKETRRRDRLRLKSRRFSPSGRRRAVLLSHFSIPTHSLMCAPLTHCFHFCHWIQGETTNSTIESAGSRQLFQRTKRPRMTVEDEKDRKATHEQAPTFAPDEAEAGLWSLLESPRVELPAIRPISDTFGFVRFTVLPSFVYRR